MPWRAEKRGKGWVIVRSDTGEVAGHSKTEAEARASVRARYANTSAEVDEAVRRVKRQK